MNVYGTEQIRNVVLLGHGGAGKTTVAEALAMVTGVTKRMGKVPDGNTISDYDKEEIKRQFSISTTLIPLEYQGDNGPMKLNLLDTPGFFDFVGEVEEAISVADAAIIVVNCKAGIEPGTEKAWEMCEKYPPAPHDFCHQHGRRPCQLPRAGCEAGDQVRAQDRPLPAADS